MPPGRDTDKRVDASDGKAYTKKEFHEQYGGYSEWDASAPARAGAASRGRGGSGGGAAASDLDGFVNAHGLDEKAKAVLAELNPGTLRKLISEVQADGFSGVRNKSAIIFCKARDMKRLQSAEDTDRAAWAKSNDLDEQVTEMIMSAPAEVAAEVINRCGAVINGKVRNKSSLVQAALKEARLTNLPTGDRISVASAAAVAAEIDEYAQANALDARALGALRALSPQVAIRLVRSESGVLRKAENPSALIMSRIKGMREEAVERRVDDADGNEYTRAEFRSQYGGEKEWNAAPLSVESFVIVNGLDLRTKREIEAAPAATQLALSLELGVIQGARSANALVMSKLRQLLGQRAAGRGGGGSERRADPADGGRYTKGEFLDCYGGYKEWDAAAPRAAPYAARGRGGRGKR